MGPVAISAGSLSPQPNPVLISLRTDPYDVNNGGQTSIFRAFDVDQLPPTTGIFPRNEGVMSSAGVPKGVMSTLDDKEHTHVSLGPDPKQPRKLPQQVPGKKARTSDTKPTIGSGLAKTQADAVEGIERLGDREQAQTHSSPETIHYNLEPDAGETASPEVEESEYSYTYYTTTTTEEHKTTDVQISEQTSTAKDSSPQPRKTTTKSSSRTTTGQDRFPVQGGISRKASFYQETRFPTEPGRSPIVVSAAAVETRHFGSRSTYNSAAEYLGRIERLHREEKDSYLAIMKAEHEDRTRFYEEQLQELELENRKLIREASESTSRLTLLQIQLDSHDNNAEYTSEHDQENVAAVTHITTITTTISTVTKRIEQWKKHPSAQHKGQVVISSKELDQLASELVSTSSQMTELQKTYADLLKDINSIRRELQVSVSRSEEKDRTIDTLTVDVAQWKNADVLKVQEIASLRRENDSLRSDLSVTSSQTDELQRRFDAQTKELASVRGELQAKTLLIEERDHTIASLNANITHLEQSDAAKAEQITIIQQDCKNHRNDYSTLSSRTTELQKRYELQSKEILTVRNELKEKVSLLEERGHTIASLSDEITQVKREESLKTEQVAAARKEVELIRIDLSSATSRGGDLQKRCETLSQELSSVREQLHQIDLLYSKDGADQPSGNEVADHIRDALKRKDNEMEELHRELATSTTRNTELQKSYEKLSEEVSFARDELKVTTSQYEGKITTLNSQVERLKSGDLAKAEKITSTLKEVEDLQHDLSTSTSKLAELQALYETQSREITEARADLKARISSEESKDRNIATLTTELKQRKDADAGKTEKITATLKQVEELQQKLTDSASQLSQLQNQYEVQSQRLTVTQTELQTTILSIKSKDDTINSLRADVNQWENAGANQSEQMATALDQVEKLRREFAISDSQLTDLRSRYEIQSSEFISVRKELETWKRSATSRMEELDAASNDLEQLRIKFEASTSRVKSLESSDREKTDDLDAAHKDLKQLRVKLDASVSQIKTLESSGTERVEELRTARNDIEQLNRDLSAAKSQIVEHQQRYAMQSSQLEQSKESDAAKAEKLVSTGKKLEQLQQELSKSSLRITELEELYQTQTTELTSLRDNLKVMSSNAGKDDLVAALNVQIAELQRTGADKARELSSARADAARLSAEIDELGKRHAEQLETLRESYSVSENSKEVHETMIKSEVKDYAAVMRLTAMVDQWLRADAKRAEELTRELEARNKENMELRHNLLLLKDIYVQAPELKQIFHTETVEIQRQHYEEQSRELKSQLDGVQRFVTTADTYADTMIIQALQKLNAEVQQNTTYMAECILADFQPRNATLTEEQVSATQRVSKIIGQALVGCLGRMERDDVALYLSVAFQAYLTYHLREIISLWTIEKGYNDLINEIYRRLQQKEAQTISGRWRSLTRTYILPTSVSDPSTLISSTIEGFSDIVVAAGCATSVSAARSSVSAKFGDKLTSIILIAGKFSRMIGEVVSGDFEVLAAPPLEVFDEATMEEDTDDYDEGSPSESAIGQQVLCSTQLGLTKQMPLESGEKDRLTVTKTKVLLESFLIA